MLRFVERLLQPGQMVCSHSSRCAMHVPPLVAAGIRDQPPGTCCRLAQENAARKKAEAAQAQARAALAPALGGSGSLDDQSLVGEECAGHRPNSGFSEAERHVRAMWCTRQIAVHWCHAPEFCATEATLQQKLSHCC